MKTLVIHPQDPSTDFLKEIYKDTDWTIINYNVSHSKLKELIKNHDKIIMLGHGTSDGLLGFGRHIINSSLVYLLREKQCVCIWCNANIFVEKYKLKGFYTGMIISEMIEAFICRIIPNQTEVTESNTLFAQAVKESLNKPNVVESIREIYQIENNPIIQFNRNNLYICEKQIKI